MTLGPHRRRAWSVLLATALAIALTTVGGPSPSAAAPRPALVSPALASASAPDRGAPPLGTAAYDVPADARFVAPGGNDAADGSVAAPWRTLGHAVERSPSGSTIVLRAGTYRESVQVYGKQLTIQPAPGERVVLSGSDAVGGWVREGAVWRRDRWTPSFARTNVGGSHLIDPAHPLAAWPEQAFLDGVALRQVATRAEVVPGAFLVDDAADRLYLGSDPTARTVEVTARPWGIYLNRAHGSTVRGIAVRHYGTPLSDIAALRAYSDDVLLEDLVVERNALAGVSVIGRDVVVRNSTFARNGQTGVHGMYADAVRIIGNEILRNNVEGFDQAQAAAGLKIVRSRDVRVVGNGVLRNAGHGLWIDMSSLGVEIVGNIVRRSSAAGIHVEVSAEAIVADNVSTRNGGAGILVVESSDVEIWNNTALGNVRDLDLLDGPRTSSDLRAIEHDFRFPLPNPAIPWDLRRIRVRNNVLGGGRSGIPLFRVDDVSHLRSFAELGVSSDRNAFHRDSVGVGWVTLWSTGPQSILVGHTLAEHQRATGQELGSVAVDGGPNPWVTDPEASDFSVPPGAPRRLGSPLPDRVARALRRTGGAPVRIGVLSGPRDRRPRPRIELGCSARSCRFSGARSSDDGTITAHRWRLPGGTRSTGVDTASALPSPGRHQVVLTVVDETARRARTAAEVVVPLRR